MSAIQKVAISQKDDVAELTALNALFIDAVLRGDLNDLNKVLTSDFQFMVGSTGEIWDRDKYDAEICIPGHYVSLTFDQLYIQVNGDAATVSARTHAVRRDNGQEISGTARYVDVYTRIDGRWWCVFAGLWRV